MRAELERLDEFVRLFPTSETEGVALHLSARRLVELRQLVADVLRAADAETPALKSGELPACSVELLPAEQRADNEPGLFVRPGIDVRYPERSARVSHVGVKLSADRSRGVVVLHLAEPVPPASASCLVVPVEVRP